MAEILSQEEIDALLEITKEEKEETLNATLKMVIDRLNKGKISGTLKNPRVSYSLLEIQDTVTILSSFIKENDE